MALYDDPFWLLSHIAHSFVLSDETGNSELVLTAQDAKFVKEKAKSLAKENGTDAFLAPLNSLYADDDDGAGGAAHSFEIRLLGGRQYGGMAFHRPRCNTEIKLEKMKRERRNLPRVRTVNWREQPNGTVPEDELEKLFPRKDLESAAEQNRPPISSRASSTSSSKPRSLLSAQLDLAPLADANPFEAFSQFDAQNAAANEKTRKLQVFIDMAEVGSSARNYPLLAHVRVSAKISEVVGYVCWKYTHEGRQPKLRRSLNGYSLYMAESDGSIERDFPALDRKELLAKYGFTVLGLVDELPDDNDGGGVQTAAASRPANPASFSVTVVMPDGTFSVLDVESRDISVKQLRERALSRRREANPRVGFKYNVELKDAPGEALDPDAPLSSFSGTEFYVVREHSRRRRPVSESAASASAEDDAARAKGRLRPQISAAEATLYKEYDDEVYLLSSIRTRVGVVLAFSEEGLEVYPKQVRAGAIFWKSRKPVVHSMEGLVACDIVDTKQSGRWVFRIVISTETGYVKHVFEAAECVAEEIHDKINYLLKGRPSQARTEYLAYKERKLTRKSWHAKVK